VGGFLIPVKRPYVQLSSPGQTEGLKSGCGMGGWVGLRDGWMGGFKEWVDGWAEREGKGGVWV
jgi:hypothetical protein